VTNRDELIRPLVDKGLDALEVYHSDHQPEDVIEYKGLATRLGVLVTGGSDFHGDADKPEPSFAKATEGRRGNRAVFGVVTLPAADLAALEKKVRH